MEQEGVCMKVRIEDLETVCVFGTPDSSGVLERRNEVDFGPIHQFPDATIILSLKEVHYLIEARSLEAHPRDDLYLLYVVESANPLEIDAWVVTGHEIREMEEMEEEERKRTKPTGYLH